MARIRTIKPGFFTNDVVGELSKGARLLFIGLWTSADKEGRLEDRPKRIKVELMPYDDDDVDELLHELAKSGFILRYTVENSAFIQIINFAKHQRPHPKEPDSLIPAPVSEAKKREKKRQAVKINGETIPSNDPAVNKNNIMDKGKGMDNGVLDNGYTWGDGDDQPIAATPRVRAEKPAEEKIKCPTCSGMVMVRTSDKGRVAICLKCKADVLTFKPVAGDKDTKKDAGKCLSYYGHRFEEIFGIKPHLSKGKDFGIIEDLLKDYDKKTVQGFIDKFLLIEDDELKHAGYPLAWLPSRITGIKLNGKSPPKPFKETPLPYDPDVIARLGKVIP